MISDKFHTDELETDFLWKFYIFPKEIFFFYLSFAELLYCNSERNSELNPVFYDSKQFVIYTLKLARIIIIYKLHKNTRLEECIPFPTMWY